jgi:hypothetical protein
LGSAAGRRERELKHELRDSLMADKYEERMNARVADVMEMKRGLICDDG